MHKHSVLDLLRHGLAHNRTWPRMWRTPEPKPEYDAVIVGGGGHGLATAYYLAKEHGIRNVAVLEKGWLGGGNTARNTTIIRSNYLQDSSAALYDFSIRLWEGLSAELGFNVMFSQRGVIHLAHSIHDLQEIQRRGNAIHLNGVDSEFLDPARIRRMLPLMNLDCRFPVLGALHQRRGGVARHDAVAWGFARAADAHGVDIIQRCEVLGFRIRGGTVTGVETTRGFIGARVVGCAAAAASGVLANMAGFRLPLETSPLQAFVSEPVRPFLHHVVMSNAIHLYVSQSSKGELVMGAGSDPYVSYAQRGSFDQVELAVRALLELFPSLSRLRFMRQWAGNCDITADRSPIISSTPVRNLFVNCGWGTGGFKATPASGFVFAHCLAHGTPHPLAEPFGMDRFHSGALIDEGAAATVAH
ncbi:sarcosine oxidase subunit beta family protein [Azospirillum sp. TSO22-1]|uniref:sarcosine oxidase subunit beta family protein n=1 Tax=Azospirillum sp. TSO22-1 TaxID=716789 RepID=UPI000D6173B9|nr:sarcosine oxidase subunit beta family protein [Azospirillum sp. TSO22-1]PWC56185.1 sarcosine oxidase subunit beta [Azospirillum sp. TSO22-1]